VIGDHVGAAAGDAVGSAIANAFGKSAGSELRQRGGEVFEEVVIANAPSAKGAVSSKSRMPGRAAATSQRIVSKTAKSVSRKTAMAAPSIVRTVVDLFD
jgi:hypothetical protein